MKFRKSYIIILFLTTVFIFNFSNTHLFLSIDSPGAVNICNSGVLEGLKYFSYLVYVLKVLIPVFIILKSGISFANAFIAGDDSQIKPTFNIFLKRCFVGAVIFYIPTIIDIMATIVTDISATKGKFDKCVQCMVNPNNCTLSE